MAQVKVERYYVQELGEKSLVTTLEAAIAQGRKEIGEDALFTIAKVEIITTYDYWSSEDETE